MAKNDIQKMVVNAIIEWADTPVPHYDRILQIDSGSATIVVIDVTNINDDDAVKTVVLSFEAVEEAFRVSNACITDKDPYLEKLSPKMSLTDQEKARVKQILEIIEPVVSNNNVFNPKVRSILIRNTAKDSGRDPKMIRLFVHRYWRGGEVEQVLLPRYHRCGTNRKEDKKKNYAKLGRRSNTVGVNMDAVAEERFRTGIKLFYENEKGRSLRYAYEKTRETFFYKGKYEKHGVMVPQLPPSEEIPSYRQFVYFFKKNQNIVATSVAREGQYAHNLHYRAIPGDSTLNAEGPGYLAQLDPTIGDVYLVSEFDRARIIGRPVIYIVIDVFTRLIIGLSVSLEAPSWLGAMLSLENMVSKKADFCREYGYTITEADWPSHHLPKAIVADRGELLSKNSDSLGKILGIKVINTPPYRPDWKAIVERYFRVLNDTIIDWIPGAVREYLPRSGHDYRLDSCLTLYELRQLLIGCILEHNMSHKIEDYPRDKDMIADGVQPYPVQLWNWGITNRRGKLRERPPVAVRIDLLPPDKASITPEGIRFKGLYYECERAWKEKWFEKARLVGYESMPMAYDPRTVERIYLRMDQGRQVETCTLMPKSQMWVNFDWRDIEDRRRLEKRLVEEPAQQARQTQAEIHTKQEQIIRDAQEKTSAARTGLSNADLKRGISENRAEELEYERAKELHLLTTTASAIPNTASSLLALEEDTFMTEQAQWLRKMRDGGIR